MMIAPIPTMVASWIVVPWMIALCPMVTSSPTTTGASMLTWTTVLSWTLLRRPIVIGAMSPRTVALYQTLASSPIVTLPMTTAVGAMNALSAILGQAPSYGRITAPGYRSRHRRVISVYTSDMALLAYLDHDRITLAPSGADCGHASAATALLQLLDESEHHP